MATYEDDHNLLPSTTPNPTSTTRRHRLNISDFFSSTSTSTTTSTTTTTATITTSTVPPPSAFATLAATFSEMAITPVMEDLLASLRAEEAGGPPAGVPDGWTDGLERVAKSALKKDDVCAICNAAFLDDPYPLVVRLPCHEMHVFDLECIAVWLRLHSTCPLDRTDLLKKKKKNKQQEPPPPPPEEDDDEWDENYG
ncbi:hypothetical protein EV426DRAFT_612805 [Tirmania nivea]|nr:hypothetical protein EV426DRAFT_612805 [Tirmania nivea]